MLGASHQSQNHRIVNHRSHINRKKAINCKFLADQDTVIPNQAYPAVYLVAIFFAAILALPALSSVNFLSMNPSPLHSAQIPDPPQSPQTFEGLCRMRKECSKSSIEKFLGKKK